MPDSAYFAVFLVGLLGGTHCVGMCGGIVSALSLPTQPKMPSQKPSSLWPVHLGYNLGRIGGYVLAGAAMGAVGSASLLFNQVLPVQLGLYVLANVMLVAMGLYLLGLTRALAWSERIGQRLWRRIQPFAAKWIPARSFTQALPLGLAWGFLPCGLVYSGLSAALLAGSSAHGAALMLAFGLGTLPNLLLAGLLLVRFRRVVQHSAVRVGSGLLVIGFGVWGLLHVESLGGKLWQGLIC